MSIDPALIHTWMIEAGQMAVKYFKHGCKWHLKDNNTYVTEADRAVEAFLVEKIKTHYPDHAIIAEEGSRALGKEFAWVVDPIDGTSAFVWGVPTWCISIGVLRNWESYFGLIYLPITQETYMTDEQGRADWNGHLVKVSSVIDTNALLCVSPRTLQRYTISFPGYVSSFASGILHNCLVARGTAVAAMTIEPNIWDLAGIYPILKAAGATIQYISGEPFRLRDLIENSSREPLVVGHPTVIRQIVAAISPL
jgi:fructose-1,6-bisphosphatase/inositol monophosphatase family enzyme